MFSDVERAPRPLLQVLEPCSMKLRDQFLLVVLHRQLFDDLCQSEQKVMPKLALSEAVCCCPKGQKSHLRRNCKDRT
jgi:hypothetical protein